MARKVTLHCDVCGKECSEIVRKLFLSPSGRQNNTRAPHSEYTHHLDVGNCCYEPLMKSFKWKKRLTAKEYQASRKNGRGG